MTHKTEADIAREWLDATQETLEHAVDELREVLDAIYENADRDALLAAAKKADDWIEEHGMTPARVMDSSGALREP